MNKGKRYDGTPKLNRKKVFITLLIIIAIIVGIVVINKKPKQVDNGTAKNVPNSYIAVYTHSKWGVINSKGENVVKPNYSEMIIIPNNVQEIFIVQDNVDIDNETFNSYAINGKEEKLFTEYDKVEALQNIKRDGSSFYNDSVLKVCKDNKYGLINFSGKVLLEPNYDSISCVKYIENSFLTEKDGKLGVVDNAGNIIVENKYSEITALTDKFEDGYVIKTESGKYGLIKYSKQQVLSEKYDYVKPFTTNNYYIVGESGKHQLVDQDQNVKLTSEKLKNAVGIDKNYITIKDGDNYSLIDLNGSELLTGYQYLKYSNSGNYIAKKDGKVGIIDSGGNTKVEFIYTDIVYLNEESIYRAEKEDNSTDLLDTNLNVKATGIISEINIKSGYIKVRSGSEYKYYNFKLEEKSSKDIYTTNTLFLSKKNGKYGFVDKNDVVVVDYIYDDATEQNDYGYAAIKKDGLWGCIDQKGTVIMYPTLPLSQNLVINFIGKWHLAPDLNANYYTDDIE
jgi:hypothetical protein